MGLKVCDIVMRIGPDARSRHTLDVAVGNLFERWAQDFFSPRAVDVWLNGARTPNTVSALDPSRRVGTQPLWVDETIAGERPLTVCSPDEGSRSCGQLRKLLASHAPESLLLRAAGALRHRAADEPEPRWYGRWRIPSRLALSEIVEIRLEWSAIRREIEILFRLSGYPLTSVQPLLSERLAPADSGIAAENRSAIFHALKAAPACIGLSNDEVSWFDDGDYGEMHPQDAVDIRDRWLPWLATDDGTNPEPVVTNVLGGDPERLWTLEEFIRSPTRDGQVIAAIEALLNDTTPCRIEEHYIGEVRLLAAMALAAKRVAAGDRAAIRVTSVPPLRTADLLALTETAGLQWPTLGTRPDSEPFDAALVAFATLRDRGLIGEREIDVAFPFDLRQIVAHWAPKRAADHQEPHREPIAHERQQVPGSASEDVQFYIRMLSGDDAHQQALALRELAQRPTGDIAVREAVERLLGDDTPCVLQIPYRFGELRLLAAAALAAERSASGVRTAVVLRTIRPLDADQLEQARQASGVGMPEGSNALVIQLQLFATLRNRGLLQQIDVEFPPGRHHL